MGFGQSFSSVFGVAAKDMRRLGVLDPTLDVDARLFIDPFLLPHSQHTEFKDCAFAKYEEHFTQIYKLIILSQQEGDKAWKAALRKFQFSESKGMSGTCLGYSKASTHGHAFGPQKAAQSLRWAKQVIDLGVKDPEMFSSLSLFEDGIGADLISDMIAAITVECIIAFNHRILNELNKTVRITTEEFTLQGHKAMLPRNPFSNHGDPIILLADDILKHLPIMDDPKQIPQVIEGNENLRDRVNEHIGEVFATKSKKDKERIKDRAMQNAAAFQSFLDMLKLLEQSKYNVHEDPEGLLVWRDVAESTTAINKLQLTVDDSLPRLDRINKVVESILAQFTRLVEKNRLNRVFHFSGKPRKEAFAQLLFYAISSSYCDAADIGMTAEADAGVGPVDFKFNDGADNVLVEIKLSTNSATVTGYEAQLGAYGEAERAGYGHYVVIDVGKLGKKWKRLTELRASNAEFAKRNFIHLVDGTLKPSASNRK
ncbi:hypothetical protein [Roseivivax sp.]